MRLILDTSVILAGLRSADGASRLWIDSILRLEHDLLLSDPLVLEYESVLLRPVNLNACKLSGADVGQLLDAFCAIAVPVEISFLWRPFLNDPDDEMVLEAAMAGQADMLLTFNIRDFVAAERLGIKVSLPGPAWTRWKGRSS